METYSFLRELADSWVLLAMVCFFLGVWIFAFLPALQKDRDAAAAIPFKEDRKPCAKNCSTCACKIDFLNEVDHG